MLSKINLLIHCSMSTGLIGALQTDERYHGCGYGSLVVRHLSKKSAELGYDVYASVDETNTPSCSVFSKLGFKIVDNVHWITTNSKNCSHQE